jgi:hypothetical protein
MLARAFDTQFGRLLHFAAVASKGPRSPCASGSGPEELRAVPNRTSGTGRPAGYDHY